MTFNRRAFLRRTAIGAAGLCGVSFLPACRSSRSAPAAGQLPRRSPESQGVSSAGILAFLEAVQASKHEMHSFMLVRHGAVVAEGWWSPYGPQYRHTLYSLSKSFTSTAVGFAVTEGRLKLEDRVATFFPNDLPGEVTANLQAMRVKDLLMMAAGHENDPTWSIVEHENWAKAFLAWPVPQPPGSLFVYNSGATYMLSAIVQQVTGQRMADYLQPRLFEPLAIEGAKWEVCPRGINVGGWGLSVTTESLAKFGQLYLQRGMWQGRELLPAAWVDAATSFKIQQPLPAKSARPKERNDWVQGYCYQFWRCTHDAYRGDGAFGQFLVVLPEQDAVVAITAETSDMQGELDLVWQHLLPALQRDALPPARQEEDRLREKLASLALPPLKSQPPPPLAAGINGKVYQLEANSLGLRSASFQSTGTGCVFTARDGQQEYPVACGIDRWQFGETAFPGTPPRLISGGAPPKGTKARVAASAGWVDAKTLEMLWRYYETPHHDNVTCRFEGDTVQVAFLNSMVQMGPNPKDKRGVVRGKISA